jgi:hypothetical protein
VAQIPSLYIHSMPPFARSVSVNFLFRMKCLRINGNQPSTFARTAATQIPAMVAKMWTPILKHRDCTLPALAPRLHFHQAGAPAAFTSKILHNFANFASTCLQSRKESRQMIGLQHTITARTADQLDLLRCDACRALFAQRLCRLFCSLRLKDSFFKSSRSSNMQ